MCLICICCHQAWLPLLGTELNSANRTFLGTHNICELLICKVINGTHITHWELFIHSPINRKIRSTNWKEMNISVYNHESVFAASLNRGKYIFVLMKFPKPLPQKKNFPKLRSSGCVRACTDTPIIITLNTILHVNSGGKLESVQATWRFCI